MGVTDTAPQPDSSVVRQHLEHITRRWDELDAKALFEVRFLTADDRAQVRNVARFSPDATGIDMAVDHIAAMNEHHLNAYVVVNPIDAARKIETGKAATDADILGSFFHWADADDAQAAENIRSFVGPKPTYFVLTGTAPTLRPHVYWELEDATQNLAAWTDTQKAIAATLRTDPAVVNPSRIMRIAGTINWPKPSKQEKGYIAERTTLRIYDEDERPLVTSERMARAFAGAQATATEQHGTFHIDTGAAHKTSEQYADMLQRARTDGQKHTGVRDLAASLAAQGVKPELASAIIKDACPVWDDNVEALIATAYLKFAPGSPQPKMTEEQWEEVAPAVFKKWQIKDISKIPYPEFLYSDFYARGYTSLTLASPKVGKSMLGLAEALDMASGRGFLTGVPREKLRVVYYNAEDDQDVLDARVAALLELYGVDQSEIADTFWPTSGVENDDFFLIAGQEGMINEPLFVAIEKFCIEQKADVLIFDPLQDLSASPETNEVFRAMGQRLRRLASQCRVALGLIHHTRKIAPGMQATIEDGRGGSALRGTARFNRILNPMTEDEAAKAGVENHRFFFRIGDMESNLAPPSADVNRWFEKKSVPIQNGQHIGAVAPWKWPDVFDGVTPQQAAQVRGAIDRMPEPPRENVRSPQWVGWLVGEILGLNIAEIADKERVKQIISGWVNTDVLRVAEVEDKRAGRVVKVIVSGANNPLAAGGQHS